MPEISPRERELLDEISSLRRRIAREETKEFATSSGGAVDSVNGQTGVVVLDQDDVGDGTTYKQYSATEKTKLAGIETGADVTDAGNVGTAIDGATGKTTPIDADTMPLIDSAASNVLKKVTWANIKATLKTYFDTLYNLYVHPNHTGDVTSTGDGATVIGASKVLTTMIADDNVTYAKMQNIATDSLIGRDTASSGDPETIGLNATLAMDGAGNLQRAALTGDVTASAGSNATTIANDAVTNAKAANMAADTIKGRANGAGTGDPTDLTATQVRTIINVADGADVTGTAVTALAAKTTPVDADSVVITDSAASDAPKRTTGTNFKAYLKAYWDTLYAPIAKGVTNGDSHDHNGGDGAAIPNAGLANSSVTIGSTSVSLGATAATVAGLTLTTPTIASFTNATHNHTNAAGGGQLDHGAALTGLGDDDHTQYHNDTRGDARYVALTGAQTVAGVKDFTNGLKVANGTTLTHLSSGTWTITLRFGGATTGITYGTQTGTYLRINNRVWLHGTIILTSKGSATGAADISGLPFTVATTTVAATRWRAMNTSYIYLTVVPLTGTTTMTFRATTAAAAGVETTLADTNFTNTSTITFEATYEV